MPLSLPRATLAASQVRSALPRLPTHHNHHLPWRTLSATATTYRSAARASGPARPPANESNRAGSVTSCPLKHTAFAPQSTRRHAAALLGQPRSMPPESTRSPQAPRRTLATTVHGAGVDVPPPSPLDALPPGYEVRSEIGGHPSPHPYAVFTKPLEVPAQDDRAYRLVKLANGLEVLLVHDAKTDKSAAAMDVRVGHLSDPKELQGLAHFCEHLLFMGTKKYPRENEYSEYLANHSGSSNAYTGMDNTNYFFDVGHSHLEGALDRFAQFFLEPLFDPSCTEREIRAVDSEHKKNLQSDAWRGFQLDKSLSDPAHPYSHFGTGSAQTLWEEPRARGQDVREELLKFHDRYYSANVMKLVVLGRESLDQLTTWAVDKFSGVRNKGLAAPTFPASPFGPEQLRTEIFFRSVKDIRLLDITFPIPDQGPQFRTKPGQIISHFIGHEGRGSILSALKARGWANHLSAGATNGADGFEFFKVSVDLTSDGLAHYRDVIATVFRYIELLRTSSVPEWSFGEVQQLCELAFRFKEKSPPSSFASQLSSQMQMPYPRDWVLSGPYLAREFDAELIQRTAQCLSPENCRITVAAQQTPDGAQKWEKRERWYGTEYTLQALPSELLKPGGAQAAAASAAPAAGAELALPSPNTFIPAQFEVAASEPLRGRKDYEPAKRPTLLRQTPLSRLWHKRDDTFLLPKANVFMLLRSPLLDATPANAVKTRVLIELLKDALTEYSYDAELAGLGYNIEAQADGIGLSVDGYNDKLAVLLRAVLEQLARLRVDERRFEIIKDQVRRGYQNFSLEAPYQHANYFATYLLVERMWTPEEKLRELEPLRAADAQAFVPELLSRLHVEMLAHGNLSRAEAESLAELAERTLSPRPLTASELVSARSLLLPPGSSHRWALPVANAENVNSSLEFYCQVGDPTDVALRARLLLFAQIAQEPVFDQLRTKEQLGYLVFSSLRRSIGSMGWRVLLQSERDSDYLESRVEATLLQLRELLATMPEERFESARRSLVDKKREVCKNLWEESGRYWFHVHSGYYDFLQRDVDVEALGRVTRAELLEFFDRYLHPQSAQRAKLVVHLQSRAAKATDASSGGVPARFSARAAEALRSRLEAASTTTAGVELPPAEAWAQLAATQPGVAEVKSLVAAQAAALGDEARRALESLVDECAAAHPFAAAESAPTSPLPSAPEAAVANVEVREPARFKAALTPSKAASALASWEEMARPHGRDYAWLLGVLEGNDGGVGAGAAVEEGGAAPPAAKEDANVVGPAALEGRRRKSSVGANL